MSTGSLFGIFCGLALVFGCEQPKPCLPAARQLYSSGIAVSGIHSASFLNQASDSRRLTSAVAFQDGTPQSPGAARPDAVKDSLWFWGVLSIAMAAVLFYLLVQIRRRQALGSRNKVLEEEVKVLFHNAPCGYHTVDEKGVIVNANDTLLRWLGYTRDEVVNKMSFTDLLAGENASVTDKVASATRTKSRRIDVALMKKNGEHMPVILSAVDTGRLQSNEGKVLYSTVDNTRCHEAVARIQTLDQELEAFSYSISHDLRAPLRSIDGYSKILEEDYGSTLDDEGRRVLGVVMNNAKRMGKLIDDLLDFGRLGRKALQLTAVNMTAMVQNLMQELSAQANGRSLEVKIEPLLPATCDADMMRQVWFNLLENAVKYTGKKDKAVINVRSYKLADTELCYEVKDNGVGFDMQYTDKLFGMFQRLHKMQDFSGTGVGLAIVKRIITRHGGRVWAEGSLEAGATFYFTLPVDDENR